MPASKHHELLIAGGVGLVGFLGYEFIYKPWAAGNAAPLDLTSGLPSFNPTSMLTTPTVTNTTPNPGGVQGSIIDPRVSPGGDVGQAMWLKNWTQKQATDRLAAIKTGIANTKAGIAQLSSTQPNPAASGIPAAQLAMSQEQAAIVGATQAMNDAVARGDTANAQIWRNAIAAHQQDIAELQARINNAAAPVDNSGAIAQYQGALAALLQEYKSLTGVTLS